MALGAAFNNIRVNTANLIAAFFGLWVLTMLIAAAGWFLASLNPSWAIGLLTGAVLLSYLAELLANLFKLPDWIINLSIFHLYGQPLVTGLNWTTQLLMLGATGLLLALAVFCFQRRDILH